MMFKRKITNCVHVNLTWIKLGSHFLDMESKKDKMILWFTWFMLNWNSSKMSWHHNNWASAVQQVRGKWPCCILKRIELVKVEEEYQPVVRAARILLSKLTSVTAVPPTKKAFTCKGREGSFALLLWEVPLNWNRREGHECGEVQTGSYKPMRRPP